MAFLVQRKGGKLAFGQAMKAIERAVVARVRALIRAERPTQIEGGLGLANLARYESLAVLQERYRYRTVADFEGEWKEFLGAN